MVKHLITVVETEFPKVLALAVAIGDLASGHHLAGTAGLDWTAIVAAAASTGLSVKSEAAWGSFLAKSADTPSSK